MIGAIIGDIAGSRFELVNHKSKDFEIFHRHCRPTDDSVMSLAVAQAILESKPDFSDLSEKAVSCMQSVGKAYPNAGYGGTFINWIFTGNPQPYNSWGNGAGMRVGPCGFAAGSLEEAQKLSGMVTEVTHNHPEGKKGAEAIASSVFLARSGRSKDEIQSYAEANYYPLDFTIDAIRPTYSFDVSCQGSVPVAVEAFLDSTDFEDAIRTAISVGGDSDTIGAMTGVIAEAFYGVPESMITSALTFLDRPLIDILYRFEQKYPSKAIWKDGRLGRVADVIEDYQQLNT